jgi:hypothetical protein
VAPSGDETAGTVRGNIPLDASAALVLAAVVSFTGAGRIGGGVGRLERAERLSFLLEARAYEQAALDSRMTAAGRRPTGPRPAAPSPSAKSSAPP